MMDQETTVTLTPDLQEATANLAENLLHAEPFLAFAQTKSRLDANDQASDLLAQLSAAQAELRTRQARNLVSQEDIETLRTLQRIVQANPTIMGFAESQKAAMDYLADINQEISRAVGFDFAALASPSCCG